MIQDDKVKGCYYLKRPVGTCLTVLPETAKRHNVKRLTQNDSGALVAGAFQIDEALYLPPQPGLIKQPGDYILRLNRGSLLRAELHFYSLLCKALRWCLFMIVVVSHSGFFEKEEGKGRPCQASRRLHAASPASPLSHTVPAAVVVLATVAFSISIRGGPV